MDCLYSLTSGERFYMANTVERDATVRAGWMAEGIEWYGCW